MTRWTFSLYQKDTPEPFHRDYHEDKGGTPDAAGLPLRLAVAVRIALNDERVQRIELTRAPGTTFPTTDQDTPSPRRSETRWPDCATGWHARCTRPERCGCPCHTRKDDLPDE